MEGSQARQDDRTCAMVMGKTRVRYPPAGQQFVVLSYTWRGYHRDIPIEDRKHDMCLRTQMTGRIYVQLGTCFKFDGDNVLPQDDNNAIDYSWYTRADVCLVYLQDTVYTENGQEMLHQLQHDRWFTEPWALQELLASNQIYFYSQEGICFKETKCDLLDWLEKRTRIERHFLKNPNDVGQACIAKRMSWAATRNYATSDAVHSLKGMFNVSMTRKINESMSDAFHRLQVILIQSYSYDLSIFAWTDETRLHSRDILLANSPGEFASCSQIELVKGDWDANVDPIRDEHAILDVLLQFPGNDQKYLLCLNCSYKSSGLQLPGIAIWVRLNTDTGYLERINLTKTEVWEGTSTTEPVTVESSGRVKTGALV